MRKKKKTHHDFPEGVQHDTLWLQTLDLEKKTFLKNLDVEKRRNQLCGNV